MLSICAGSQAQINEKVKSISAFHGHSVQSYHQPDTDVLVYHYDLVLTSSVVAEGYEEFSSDDNRCLVFTCKGGGDASS